MGASLSPLRAQRILELSPGCIGHLHGPAEESRGWGLWDPHNPPRLWDRPGSAWVGPASCQNHPALGCLTPSCLLLQLRPGGLVPTSSEGFVHIPDQGAPWTHCGCRSWIYWWILIQGCTLRSLVTCAHHQLDGLGRVTHSPALGSQECSFIRHIFKLLWG